MDFVLVAAAMANMGGALYFANAGDFDRATFLFCVGWCAWMEARK